MEISASNFKARCLALIDRVRESGESITITKRGRIVASLVPAGDQDEHPWRRLRGTVHWEGNAFAAAIDESEIDALR